MNKKEYTCTAESILGVDCKISITIPESHAVLEEPYFPRYLILDDCVSPLSAESYEELKRNSAFSRIGIYQIKTTRVWPSGLRQIGNFFDKKRALLRIKDKTSIETLSKYIYEEYDKRVKYRNQDMWLYTANPIDRHIGKIGPFIFDRIPENTNKNTFDFIRCDVSIMGVEDKYIFCKENYKEIIGRVLDKLESSQSFKKYHVPTNILRVSRATVLKDGDLAILFEIKS